MDDILAEFIAETRETLDAIAGELVAWEADPQDRERLDAIFRFVHTVKGSCGFLELPRLEQLSHAAEDVLSEVRDGKRAIDPSLVSGVLAVVDRISELVEAIDTGGAAPEGGDDLLIAALRAEAVVQAEPVQGSASGAKAAPARSIRISLDLLDRMMSEVSDLVLARNELARRLQEAGVDPAVEGAFERLSGTVGDIRDAITRTRMQRIEKLFGSIPRMVRDLSAELGKSVELEIDGGDVELDREMIELIRDPLTHIIRNALDHGIESQEERRKAGKPVAGRLHVAARQSGNQILIDVADDGRGIDAERLVAKAIAAGVLTQARADALSPEAKLALVFEPGLSTARAVTALSGRGVGMDVVRSNIERIGGVVELDSRPGKGLTLTIRVPLTLTIIPALTVSAGGEFFAIPRVAIQEIVRETSGSVQIETIGTGRIARVRNVRVPIVDLEAVLGLDAAPTSEARSLVVLNPAGGAHFAISVAALHDHQELVIRPSCPAVMATGVYAGMTLPDTGRPMLLLDPAGIADKAGVQALGAVETGTQDAVALPEEPRVSTLLFRDLDGVERAVRLAVVERIEEVAGEQIRFAAGRLRLAIDGRIIPLVGFDRLTERSSVAVLRLNDGKVELAYAIDEVLDIVALTPELQPAPSVGVVAGVALLDGRQIEVLDPYWLFAEATGGMPVRAARPLCLLGDADDPWTAEVLRPLVEAAGYRAAFAGEVDPASAAIVIAGERAEIDETVPPGRVLRLRDEIAARETHQDSVYRYDRAALMSALQAGRAGGRA